jgi:hypothetical protein
VDVVEKFCGTLVCFGMISLNNILPLACSNLNIDDSLSFTSSGYVTDVLDDAKVYAGHAGKKTIDGDDVRLAVQCKMDHSFTSPPPRDVSLGNLKLISLNSYRLSSS